ncbi:hypothetical protein TPHV1_40097 [Treponema phagedenis]|uniref:Uncharacterized protein n=1 Tax=Treponema phagedenis TaxID=162 RepID=A0A0B7GVA0_TREPH|nr:hypothetical protein TPHV1_40097 [Treponema phagedenis]
MKAAVLLKRRCCVEPRASVPVLILTTVSRLTVGMLNLQAIIANVPITNSNLFRKRYIKNIHKNFS